jgi:alpha/beta superfamily hydrolase
VAKLVQKLSSQRYIEIDYRLIRGADHFFGNCLDQLTGHVEEYVSKALAAAA